MRTVSAKEVSINIPRSEIAHNQMCLYKEDFVAKMNNRKEEIEWNIEIPEFEVYNEF